MFEFAIFLGIVLVLVTLLFSFYSILTTRIVFSKSNLNKLNDAYFLLPVILVIISLALIFKLFFNSFLAFQLFSILAVIIFIHFHFSVFEVTLRGGLSISDAISIVDVSKLSKKIKELKEKRVLSDPFTLNLLKCLKDKNIILVEVSGSSTPLPVLTYLFGELKKNNLIIPLLGPTDIKYIKKVTFVFRETEGGATALKVSKVSRSAFNNNKNILLVKPEQSHLINNFISQFVSINKELIFIGDFLDELFDSLDMKGFHVFISSITDLVRNSKAKLIMVYKKELYNDFQLEILERYGQIKLSISKPKPNARQRIVFNDLESGVVFELFKRKF